MAAMHARRSATRVGRLAPVASLPAALVAAVVVTACGVSPEDADAGQLTGVITSRQDSFSLPGGGPVESYDRVVVVTREKMLTAYERTWPGRRAPRSFEYAYIGLTFSEADLAELTASGEPPAGPAVAPVTGGRLRIAWSGEPRYLCFGTAYMGKVRTDGCALVDEDPPAEVTFQVSIGGIGIPD